jgi:RNA polymerase sigma-70 factor, ECF subfamily
MRSENALHVAHGDRKVVPLKTTDEAIVLGLVRGERWAANCLYDRYAGAILRMLRRTLGYEKHADLEDLLHEVFVEALTCAGKLRDSVALLAWLQTITARLAYRTMRRRRARRWLYFHEPEHIPDIPDEGTPPEIRQACASFYSTVRRMPAEEQLVFNLRYVEGMELVQLSEACSLSLSTTKRRLKKAEERFSKLASFDPVLHSWVREGRRWSL